MGRLACGFSLVELIAIVVILSVLSVTAITRFTSSPFQLQASRDSVVAALLLAQQRAMAQTDDIRAIVSASQVDVERRSAGTWQSIRVGNIQYPVDISPARVTNGPHTFSFNRLGQVTTPVTVSLSQGGSSVEIDVSASGFSH